MKILGVDFGLKRIGLAFAESELAEPLSVIEFDSKTVEKILAICQQYEVEEIIIGMPEGRLIPSVKKFGQKLLSLTKLPVSFQDETLTSREAIAKMIEAGRGKRTRRSRQDAIAATIILQNYLDSHV